MENNTQEYTPTEPESSDYSEYDPKPQTKKTSKDQTKSKKSTKENDSKRAMPSRTAKNNQEKMKNQTNIKVGITKGLIIKQVFPDDSDVETLFHKLAREKKHEYYDEFGVNEGDRNEEKKQETSKGKFSECKICSNKKISLNNKVTHDLVHANSSFISDLMKKYFLEFPSDNTKICCSKCNRNQLISLFNKMETLKHLSLQHIDDFKGKEKEILKQIGFFAIVKKKQPQFFNEAIKKFEFSHDQMVDFLKLYFSNEKKDQTKRDLLLGKMFLQLKNISGKKLEDEFTKGIIPDLIRNYQKTLENEKEKTPHTVSQAKKTQNNNEDEKYSSSSELSYEPSDSLNKQNKRNTNHDISKFDPIRKKVNRTEILQEEGEDSWMKDIEKKKDQDIESGYESDGGVSVAESVISVRRFSSSQQLQFYKNRVAELDVQNNFNRSRAEKYKKKYIHASTKNKKLEKEIEELKQRLNEKCNNRYLIDYCNGKHRLGF